MSSMGPTIIAYQPSTAEMAARNSQVSYASENSQGMHIAIAGAVILGVGIYMSKWWLIGIGAIVLVMGANRMQRASQTYQTAQKNYAATITNTVA